MNGARRTRRTAPASKRTGDDASEMRPPSGGWQPAAPERKPAGGDGPSHIEEWQDLRALLNASLTEQDWQAIMRRLAEAAAAGESNAVKLLIELAVGKAPAAGPRDAARPIEIIEVECRDE